MSRRLITQDPSDSPLRGEPLGLRSAEGWPTCARAIPKMAPIRYRSPWTKVQGWGRTAPAEPTETSNALKIMPPGEREQVPLKGIEYVQIAVAELQLVHGGHSPQQMRLCTGGKLRVGE